MVYDGAESQPVAPRSGQVSDPDTGIVFRDVLTPVQQVLAGRTVLQFWPLRLFNLLINVNNKGANQLALHSLDMLI